MNARSLRRIAFVNTNIAGADWRNRLAGWWVVGRKRPGAVVARPVLCAPASQLQQAVRYAQYDAADADDCEVLHVPIETLTDEE